MAFDQSVLLVRKKSRLQNYQEKRALPQVGTKPVDGINEAELRSAHDAHEACFIQIQTILKKTKTQFESCYRSELSIDKVAGRLVITLGGDGTLLDASHYLKGGLLLGVNSDPGRSVGALCAATKDNFEQLWQQVLQKQAKICDVVRIGAEINGRAFPIFALNEVLIAHQNPAATTHYQIAIGANQEVHKNSGLWVSTAAGSTGSVLSAGGHLQLLSDRRLQYFAREPYFSNHTTPKLLSGFLAEDTRLQVVNKMENGGYLYFDGPHCVKRLPAGATVVLHGNVPPLKLIVDAELEQRRHQISQLRESYHQKHERS